MTVQPLTVDQYCYLFRPRLKPPPIRHNPITAGLWSPLVSSPVSVETAPDHSSGVGSALVVSSSVELIDLFAGSDSVTPSSGCLPSCTFPLLRRSVSLPCTYDDVRLPPIAPGEFDSLLRDRSERDDRGCPEPDLIRSLTSDKAEATLESAPNESFRDISHGGDERNTASITCRTHGGGSQK